MTKRAQPRRGTAKQPPQQPQPQPQLASPLDTAKANVAALSAQIQQAETALNVVRIQCTKWQGVVEYLTNLEPGKPGRGKGKGDGED